MTKSVELNAMVENVVPNIVADAFLNVFPLLVPFVVLLDTKLLC